MLGFLKLECSKSKLGMSPSPTRPQRCPFKEQPQCGPHTKHPIKKHPITKHPIIPSLNVPYKNKPMISLMDIEWTQGGQRGDTGWTYVEWTHGGYRADRGWTKSGYRVDREWTQGGQRAETGWT